MSSQGQLHVGFQRPQHFLGDDIFINQPPTIRILSTLTTRGFSVLRFGEFELLSDFESFLLDQHCFFPAMGGRGVGHGGEMTKVEK
jgi:hypothetical protein